MNRYSITLRKIHALKSWWISLENSILRGISFCCSHIVKLIRPFSKKSFPIINSESSLPQGEGVRWDSRRVGIGTVFTYPTDGFSGFSGVVGFSGVSGFSARNTTSGYNVPEVSKVPEPRLPPKLRSRYDLLVNGYAGIQNRDIEKRKLNG
jgi:hypothetical protein